MPQRPWAIGNLIVHDEVNLRSVLTGGDGLPAARAWLSQRHGYWPWISGLSRQGYRMTLETYLRYSTGAERLAARTALLQVLNPELEEPVRLMAVDYVLEDVGRDGVLLACGPWDIYGDDAGAWHVRDLLQPNDVEGDLSGGWWARPGEGMQIAEPMTNLDINPSVEVDTTGWSVWFASCTIARTTSEAWVGVASLALTASGSNSYIGVYTAFTATDGHTYSASWRVIVEESGTYTIRVQDGANNWFATNSMTLTAGVWTTVYVENFTPAGNAGAMVMRMDKAAGNFGGEVIYCDAAQVEELAYHTPYCDGSLGDGHSWSGAAHGSTSSRTAAVLSFDPIAQDLVQAQGSVLWWYVVETTGQAADVLDIRGADNNNRITICKQADDKFDLYINGGWRITDVGSGSLSHGDVIFGYATWDFTSDSYALGIWEDDGSSYSDTDTTSLSTPTVTAFRFGASYDGSAAFANGVLDDVVILDSVLTSNGIERWYNFGRGALNARWLDVLCEAAVPLALGGVPSLDRGLVSTLVVDGDVRWRQRDGDVAFWRVYDDTWEITVDVDSGDDVWPEFRFTPRTAKMGGFAKRQWHAVKWPASNSATNYPVMLGPTDYTGDAQADGDDIRVYVDGEEVDRWLGGTLINDVNVWFLADFDPDISLTLAEAIAAAGDIDYIQFNEDIDDLPVEGIIYVESEAFYYTDKNNRTKKVTGVSRATRGTAAAGHAASTAAYWIQHDVWVYYDDGSLGAPTVDDDYEPAFDLDNSDNDDWVYTEFGEDDGLRAAQWAWDTSVDDDSSQTTANHGGAADPWEELGIYINVPGGNVTGAGALKIYNPCGWAGASLTNGEFYIHQDLTYNPKHAKLQSSDDDSTWGDEQTYNLPNTFGAWTPADNLVDAAIDKLWIRLYARTTRTAAGSPDKTYVEYADATLTIQNPPSATAASELDNYPLECTITNETTGEAIEITAGMILDQILVVNTDEKSAILDDGTRLATAVVTDTVRRDWLRLVPGENELSFEDTGTQELEIDILWDRRLFE